MSARYQNPELRQQLAAAYALGTLTGSARARFERLLGGDAALREEVTFWHERFSEFATRLQPVTPRPMVWAALARTISVDASRIVPIRRSAPVRKKTSRTVIWQTWAAAATVAAVAMGAVLVREHDRSATLAAALEAAQNRPLPYVAVFQPDAKGARWAITLHPEQNVMRIAFTGGKMPADVSARSLELWMLDTQGKPHSLGLLPVSGSRSFDRPLPTLPPEELGASLTLAVSVEPRGGSPTGQPTGKVLGAVPAVRAI
jgi:anti-sigma-K factor RskA